MATKLNKSVRRLLRITVTRRKEPLIVSLEPGETIRFRAKGRKIYYELPLQYVYLKAMEWKILEEYREKVKRYEEKKSLGLKSRKPSKPLRITNL